MDPRSSELPGLLIISTNSAWILGQMAREMHRAFSETFRVSYITESILYRQPRLLVERLTACDVVLSLSPSSVYLVAPTLEQSQTKLVTWIHHFTQWNDTLSLAATRSSVLLASTPEWKEQIRLALVDIARTDVRVEVAGYGIDTTRFFRGSCDRARFLIPSSAFTIGFVSSKSSDADGHRKGFDTFVTVVHELMRKIPNLHVALAGPDLEALENEIRELGVSVRALGYLPKKFVPVFYSSIDVYACTSRCEGGPCTLLEAMACETPVCCTDVGIARSAMLPEFSKFLCAPDDATSLARAIAELHAMGTQNRSALGKDLRLKVASQFTWDEVLNPLSKLLLSIAHMQTTGLTRRGSASDDTIAVSLADSILWGASKIRHGPGGFKFAWTVISDALKESSPRAMLRAIPFLVKKPL